MRFSSKAALWATSLVVCCRRSPPQPAAARVAIGAKQNKFYVNGGALYSARRKQRDLTRRRAMRFKCYVTAFCLLYVSGLNPSPTLPLARTHHARTRARRGAAPIPVHFGAPSSLSPRARAARSLACSLSRTRGCGAHGDGGAAGGGGGGERRRLMTRAITGAVAVLPPRPPQARALVSPPPSPPRRSATASPPRLLILPSLSSSLTTRARASQRHPHHPPVRPDDGALCARGSRPPPPPPARARASETETAQRRHSDTTTRRRQLGVGSVKKKRAGLSKNCA